MSDMKTPAAAPRSAAVENLLAVMARLEEVLSTENALLESGKPSDHAPFIERKNQLLRELIILQRNGLDPADMEQVRSRLSAVRTLVDRNHALLEAEVKALSDVTNMLADVSLAEQSDGTYARAQ